MPAVTVQLDTKGLLEWRTKATSTVDRMVRMAGSSAMRAMRVEANKAIRDKKAVKLAAISKVISITSPSNGRKEALMWTMNIASALMPVAGYPHRQTRKGVSIQVNVGARKLIKHAFIATMKSGHRGVFIRYGQASMPAIQHYKGHSKYAGKRRQPIRELFTSQIVDVFRDDGFVDQLTERARKEFEATLQRLMADKAKPVAELPMAPEGGW